MPAALQSEGEHWRATCSVAEPKLDDSARIVCAASSPRDAARRGAAPRTRHRASPALSTLRDQAPRAPDRLEVAGWVRRRSGAARHAISYWHFSPAASPPAPRPRRLPSGFNGRTDSAHSMPHSPPAELATVWWLTSAASPPAEGRTWATAHPVLLSHRWREVYAPMEAGTRSTGAEVAAGAALAASCMAPSTAAGWIKLARSPSAAGKSTPRPRAPTTDVGSQPASRAREYGMAAHAADGKLWTAVQRTCTLRPRCG